MLRVKYVTVAVDDLIVVRDASLSIGTGEIHIMMGPNGAGKSSLLKAIMGISGYKVIKGSILLNGKDITDLKPHERAKLGIALAHQNPPKVRVKSRYILTKLMELYHKGKTDEYLRELIKEFNVEHLLDRELYSGFSGGEIKRFELLTAILQKPRVCLLDEPDSGVDIDTIRKLATIISRLVNDGTSVLLVTHVGHIVKYLSRADVLYVMVNGRIIYRGDVSIIPRLLERGYQILTEL